MIDDGMYQTEALDTTETVAILGIYTKKMPEFSDELLEALNAIISGPPGAALRQTSLGQFGRTDPVATFKVIGRSFCLAFESSDAAAAWTSKMNYGVFAGEGAQFCPMQNSSHRVRLPETLDHFVRYVSEGQIISDGAGGLKLSPANPDNYGRFEMGYGRASDGRELLSAWVERVCKRLRGELIYRTAAHPDFI